MKDFVNLVAKMREAQQLYFRTKMNRYLVDAKRLEKEVDQKVKEYKEREKRALFGDGLFGGN